MRIMDTLWSCAFNENCSSFYLVYGATIELDLSPLPQGLGPLNLELWRV